MTKKEILDKYSDWFSQNATIEWFGEGVKFNRSEFLALVENIVKDSNPALIDYVQDITTLSF